MAAIVAIGGGGLAARVSGTGGAIVDATVGGVPFLRPYAGDPAAGFRVAAAASFPLVPFGNRIAGNAFSFEGRDYALAPNTDWDPLHLHGDGWLAEWTMADARDDRVELALSHEPSEGTPYRYQAAQVIAIADGALAVSLSVRNDGTAAMPFGIGHHPFLPLTPRATLAAPARSYWTERAGFLPDAEKPRPAELDFDRPRPLPRHWVNNGFEGWDGRAAVAWPERGLALAIEADRIFGRYFLFVSDQAFDPSYTGDYFCFEPMSHSADAHHHAGLGGLRVLAPGETFAGTVRFRPLPLTPSPGDRP